MQPRSDCGEDQQAVELMRGNSGGFSIASSLLMTLASSNHTDLLSAGNLLLCRDK